MKNFTIKISGVLLAFGLILGLALQSNATEVTFRVDMSGEVVSQDSVHIAGSFQGWNPAGTVLSPELFGAIYRVTVDIPEGTIIQYKFINGKDWGMDEFVPSACAFPGTSNRFFTVPAEAVTIPVVCFGSCNACSLNTDVTFQVDMSEQTVTSGVSLAGQFTNWGNAPLSMIDMGNGVWEITTALDPGETYEYKFVNGGFWENVSGPCSQGGNRFFEVPDQDTILSLVCFGSCIPCAVPTVAVTFQVDMQYVDVSPDSVHISGTFNEWDPTADVMLLNNDGFYEITLDLPEGDYAEYKFVNGNASADEEIVPQECSDNNARFLEIPFEDTTLDPVCWGQCALCGEPPVDVELTFQVDMSDVEVSTNGVHIAGTIQGWNPSTTPMIDAGGGIYTYTATLQSGYYHEYKFVNGSSWDDAEFVPEDCTFNGNRFIYVPNTNTTVDLVCFGSCEACPPPAEVEVTFQVDMSLEDISPEGVHLSATFNNHDPAATPMLDQGDGIYAVTVVLTEGDYQTYRYVNGDTSLGFETVPAECSQEDGLRELTVPGESTTLPEVCFGECGPCIPPPESLVTFQVDMATETIAPEGVHLAGTFQGWDPATTPMNDVGGGLYTLTLSLVEGVHQTYKFINGDSFDGAEFVPAECGEDNGTGILNRFFDVPMNDTVLGVVCYGLCTECPPPIEVTFRVDMSNEEVSEDGVHIAGSFQGWDTTGTAMLDVGEGIYSYTRTLFEGQYHQYKFINGISWINAEQLPEECAEDGNRFLVVPGVNTELDLVCFGRCDSCPPQHAINIPAGWSGLSSWVMPDETDIVSLLSGIYPELVILQTMDEMYYPSEGTNTIGIWESQSAYKIKVNQAVTLNVTGQPEQNKILQLSQGWNLVPVISDSTVDVVNLFANVGDKLVMVKDVAGTGVYWIDNNVNSIGNLIPGKAYFVLMDEAGEITFP